MARMQAARVSARGAPDTPTPGARIVLRYVLQFRHVLALTLVFVTSQIAGACGGGSETRARPRRLRGTTDAR